MNKNRIPRIFPILALIIALHSVGFSQTSDSKTVGKSETVAFLIEQNENARDLIEKQTARIADLESEVAAEKENSASVTASYDFARKEIALLQQSNQAMQRAVAVNEQTIELLKTDNSAQRERVKKANKAKWKAYGVAAVAVALKLLLP